MKKLLIVLLLFNLKVAYTQQVVSSNKGLYKTYNEFIADSPSIPLPKGFKVVRRNSSGKCDFEINNGSSIKKSLPDGSYNFEDDNGKMIGKIFGFNDGNHIYIHEVKGWGGYFPLAYMGKYPFFYYETHTSSGFPYNTYVVVDDNGEYRYGSTLFYFRKFFKKKNEKLFAEYKEADNERIQIPEFLIKLNKLYEVKE